MADDKNNSGCGNSGSSNSGNRNSGYRNSGNSNSGDWNSGSSNSGDRNSGYGNSGYRNSGYWNSGNSNSGDRNSGDWNSGDRNSGDRNSGHSNSGDRNSGYGNSCNRSTGIFCSESHKIYSFNQPTDLSWDEIDHPSFFKFYLNEWISEDEMTDSEKIENSDFHVRGGYLKTYTYKEAWTNYWRDSDETEKQKVLNLPNFDAEIFKDITGIDVLKEQGEVITVDGKRYKLIEDE